MNFAVLTNVVIKRVYCASFYLELSVICHGLGKNPTHLEATSEHEDGNVYWVHGGVQGPVVQN